MDCFFYFKNESAKCYFIKVPYIFISFIYFALLLLFDYWNFKVKLKNCERKANKRYFRSKETSALRKILLENNNKLCHMWKKYSYISSTISLRFLFEMLVEKLLFVIYTCNLQ